MLEPSYQPLRGEPIAILWADVPAIMYRDETPGEAMRAHRGRHKAYWPIRQLRYGAIDQVGEVAAHLQSPFNPLCIEGREIDLALLTHLSPQFYKNLVVFY